MASMEMAFSIKRFGIFAMVLFSAFVAGACRTGSLQADFPRVPGSVLAGDLHGPFTGRVIDRGTGRPVAGARVVVTWLYRRGVGSASPAGFVRYVGKTDGDGRYRVPSVRELSQVGLKPVRLEGRLVPAPGDRGPGGRGKLAAIRLLVYRRGYVAYRSDRVFPEGRPRLDFTQLNNKVALDKFSEEVSRLAHVRFIGDVRALGADGQGELEAASEELSGRRVAHRQRSMPAIDASKLLDESDLDVLFGDKLVFRVGRLATMKRTPDADSIHFEAVGKPQTFDFALRIWRLPGSGLKAFYEKLMRSYPGSRSRDQVGDHSFAAGNGRILAHVFMDRAHGVVVAATCGKNLCKDQTGLLKAVRLVQGRLDRIEGQDATVRMGPRLDVTGLPGRHSKPSYVPRLNQ